ncbi:conserved hypothetical protein [Ignisphaera aggregans DSM 17230]|uniref:Helix-turn-helix domain-containing protein n=1 Tax=Ignisphaera aggregans (strain DSM 17230 / JCM 13409 / AQ1.S1) TaxID=583356 RepID=E0SQS1_IGNAA|nr:conserved hypothetical protein [Ignisphaera aggregans DSM 17230]
MKISIFELGYRYILPSIKKRLVEIMLREYGYTQREIANILGLSEAAVSRYISSQRGHTINIEIYSDIDKRIRELAELIASHRIRDRYTIYRKLYGIVLETMSKKYVCSIHRELDRDIDPSRCNICPELFSSIAIDEKR